MAGAGQLLLEPLPLLAQLAEGECVAQRGEETLGGGRLLHEVGGAQLEGLHGLGGRGLAGEHHHGHGERFGQPCEQLEARLSGHAQVQQHQRRRVVGCIEDAQGLGGGAGLHGREALVGEQATQALEDARVVVHQEDARAGRLGARGGEGEFHGHGPSVARNRFVPERTSHSAPPHSDRKCSSLRRMASSALLLFSRPFLLSPSPSRMEPLDNREGE